MSRPRIRTLKPECWQDEAIGSLTHTERLLWVGLITMADDQGRLRAPVNAINGHCFPWDNLPPAKVTRAINAIEKAGLIEQYTASGLPYISLPNWRSHQKIDRPTESKLPAPPRGNISELSPNDRRGGTA